MQKSKQEVTKVIPLVRMAENLPGVTSLFKLLRFKLLFSVLISKGVQEKYLVIILG